MHDEKHVILCIDDDSDIREWLASVLTADGFEVVSAASAEDGLKRYKEALPDVVIVDLMMEEVDAGTNFVKELGLLTNRAPVYLLSSVGDELTSITSYRDLGFEGVFQKPLNQDVLLRVLHEQLRKG